MFTLVLIILFIAVFAFLGWRILSARPPDPEPPSIDTYVCPVCHENECECHKEK